MKNNVEVIEVKVPMFFHSVLIIIYPNEVDLFATLDQLELGYEDTQPSVGSMVYYGERNICVINLLIDRNNSIGTISHEILHAVEKILISIGAPTREETEEIRAHMLQYILDKALESTAFKEFYQQLLK